VPGSLAAIDVIHVYTLWDHLFTIFRLNADFLIGLSSL